jgi:predicted dehydrogenase
MNAADTHEMIRVARERKVFLMEAMWTRFLPAFVILRQMLQEGTLGEVLNLQVNFGFRATFNPNHRLFAPELGGGALLDLGIYNVSLASLVFGQQPTEILSRAHKAPTGVDDHTSMLFTYPNGASANMMCSFLHHTPIDGIIMGREGLVELHPRWFVAGGLSVTLAGQPTHYVGAPIVPNGYQYEAMEVGHCLRAGKLESDVMPLAETLAIMETLDRVQAAWG